MMLLGKVLPAQVTGDEGGPVIIIRDRESFAALVPAGSIAHQHGVSAGSDLGRDLFQMLAHDDGGTNCAIRTECAKGRLRVPEGGRLGRDHRRPLTEAARSHPS
jgi:hypothetical protein